MKMFRFLLWSLFFYLAYQILKSILGAKKHTNYDRNEPRVGGKPHTKHPLDLSKYDVEDATYHDIKKDEKNS